MKRKLIYCLAFSAFICCQQQIHAQGFLQRMKDKVNALKGGTTTPAATNSTTSNSSDNAGGPTNKTGAGLTNTAPPDVPTNIDNAQKALKDSNFSQTRYALQQAIMGVEIQLGRQIITSLPNTVDGLTKDTTKNVVMSTQSGWSNTTIETVYSDGKDKQMTVMIGNAPMYAGLVNMYFANATYIQANNQQANPNVKQTQVKGEKAIIEFDQSKGYTLISQMGQSSMMIWSCINFANEDEVMKAANAFDMDGIKKLMGEK